MNNFLLKQLSRFALLNFFFIIFLSVILPNYSKSPPPQKIAQSFSFPTPQSDMPTSPQPTPSSSSKKNLFDEFSRHNTPSDCWIVISGHIYDITTFFGSHPGGDPSLAKHCGTDATNAYNTKDIGPGRTHSADAQAMLSRYLIQ